MVTWHINYLLDLVREIGLFLCIVVRKGKYYVGYLNQIGECGQRGSEVLQCKSANRITELLRLEGTSEDRLVPTFLLKQGHLEPAVAQNHVQAPSISKDGDSTASLGNLCQCLVTLSKTAFPDVQEEPQFVLIASGPVPEHH